MKLQKLLFVILILSSTLIFAQDGGIGKVFKLGKQPININAQGYYNAVKPDGWGAFQMRLQVQFLFPIKKK